VIRAAGLAAVAVVAGAWLAYANVYGRGEARAVPWRDLTAGIGRLEFLRPAAHVYRSRARLARYLERTMPGRAPVPPAIDFGREEAVLVAAGPRSSTAYALRVVSVTSRRRAITVRLREQTPDLGDRASARLTYPYRLLTIPRSNRAVHVELEGRP
jgi:hypothetical protein